MNSRATTFTVASYDANASQYQFVGIVQGTAGCRSILVVPYGAGPLSSCATQVDSVQFKGSLDGVTYNDNGSRTVNCPGGVAAVPSFSRNAAPVFVYSDAYPGNGMPDPGTFPAYAVILHFATLGSAGQKWLGMNIDVIVMDDLPSAYGVPATF